MHSFIQKVQNADEATRKLWVGIFSAVTMAVVIAIWAFYVNNSIAKVESSNPLAQMMPTENPVQKIKDEQPGFFAVLGASLKTVFDTIKTGVSSRINSTNDILIENPEKNFQIDNAEEILPTKLP